MVTAGKGVMVYCLIVEGEICSQLDDDDDDFNVSVSRMGKNEKAQAESSGVRKCVEKDKNYRRRFLSWIKWSVDEVIQRQKK